MLARALIACSVLLLVASGCVTRTTNCAETPTDPNCRDFLDAGGDTGAVDSAVDVGNDGGIDAHVPCNGACTGAAPHCLVAGATETCVGCTGDGDCSGTMSRCEPTSHVCVACLASADCTSPTAAACNTTAHTCGGCTGNADCAHLTGTGVCDAGTCVACTVGDESACGANSCNPATHACTTTPRTSVATCHACAADSECMSTNDRCVPMQFMGAPHGSYCLRQLSAGCARPFSLLTASVVSVSGAPAAMYCDLDESVTTCEAYVALATDQTCTAPADCGATGLADGRCEMVGAFANRCTYSCGVSAQCPSGVNCGAAGYCGSP